MEILIPGVLILHIFSILMWFGSVLIQYVFLSDVIEGKLVDGGKWSPDLWNLIGRMNRTLINLGSTLAIITGVSLILIHGAEWFRPKTYVHIKITLGIIAAALSHIAMARYRKANMLVLKESPTAEEMVRYADLARSWKTLTMTTLVVLAIIVITAIFKFGM